MPTTCRPHSTTLYVTPYESPEAIGALMTLIGEAKRSIDAQLYVLTRLELVDALCEAHHRGVVVRVILDHSQSTSLSAVTALERLAATITPACIRIGTSPQRHALMHSKAAVVDGHIVATGSFNWSNDGPREVNDLLVIHSRSLATVYRERFAELWTWIETREAAYQHIPTPGTAP